MKGLMTMKNIKISMLVAMLLAGTVTGGVIVQADDDNEHWYEKYDNDDYYDDHDDDDYDDYDDDDNDYDDYYYDDDAFNNMNGVIYDKGTWNIWSRNLVMEKEELPFNTSQLVKMKVANTNKELNFYVIPKNREFFVPGKEVAQLLGAEATFYKASKILDIQYQENELIFRSDSNVIFDSNVKTPLPAFSFSLNEDLYVPISVITNGLGYIVEWQENDQVFLCLPLIN